MSDLISRQAAIEALKRKTFRLTFAEEQNCEGHVAWSADVVYSEVMEGELLELPSVQPEPKEGHWIWVAGELMCSECHTIFTDLYPDYDNSVACPHCGADMRGTKVKCGDEDTPQGGLMSAT